MDLSGGIGRWAAERIVPPGHPYVRGPTSPYCDAVARFEFKRPSPNHTGGGYPRWRSCEHRPHTSRYRGREDVFVPVHRLLAVVACYDADEPLADVLAHLDGRDVHHELEFPSANVPDELSVMGHGDHSSLSAQKRETYAKLQKRRVEAAERGEADRERCAGEGCDDEPDAAVAGERYCLACATERAQETGEQVTLG